MTVAASGRPEVSGPAGGPLSRVLVVGDQMQLLRALQINLRARQYEVLTARTGREALALSAATPPDAMILDLRLPDVDGTEVIVDYVTKPFGMGELLARLRAALRRDEEAGHGAAPVATIGRWLVDLSAHTVRSSSDSGTDPADSPAPRPTPTEWRILEILLRRPGQLVSSAQLLSGAWGPGFVDRTNYLRFHMTRLRRTFEENPSRPRDLLTEPGMGHRYQPGSGLGRLLAAVTEQASAADEAFREGLRRATLAAEALALPADDKTQCRSVVPGSGRRADPFVRRF